ncbi:Uncharacterized protein APZ42_001904 [Daphnia magna]|uniref:Uncharacterized protein n=1 Tax=Daphnia magna TaxID=35525 RepID=A0A164INC4_9CRUS|nr:Uncharacterized protein APZ42_001904 [Daphnia magna]
MLSRPTTLKPQITTPQLMLPRLTPQRAQNTTQSLTLLENTTLMLLNIIRLQVTTRLTLHDTQLMLPQATIPRLRSTTPPTMLLRVITPWLPKYYTKEAAEY